MKDSSNVHVFLGLLLAIAAGALSSPLASAAQTGGVIEGQVTLAREPMPEVTVILISREGQRREPLARTSTDVEGRFRFEGVPSGNYIVDAFAPAFVAAGSTIANPSRGKPVTVGESETVKGVQISLARGGVITGRIQDSNRQPLIGHAVSLRQLETPPRGREIEGGD